MTTRQDMSMGSLMSLAEHGIFLFLFGIHKGEANDEQKKEFLKEIQLMKEVGVHRNIVNMLGCCTRVEPMYLVVEYISNGDLLNYLRKRRDQVCKLIITAVREAFSHYLPLHAVYLFFSSSK